MDLGVHLPLLRFSDEPLSLRRLQDTVDAARECGFAALSVNDHLVFAAPWLDGLAALASVVDRSGDLMLTTTVALPVIRGPVPLAKALAALDVLSEGRLVAGVGPGSSERDYDAVGIPFDERWARFDEAVRALRALLNGAAPPREARHYRLPSSLALEPARHRSEGVPLWIGSWGSPAGLRRVARLADGWLASAYNTTPERFAQARDLLAGELSHRGREADDFPNGLSTMWTWVSEEASETEQVLADLARFLGRDAEELRPRICVGSAEHCAELLARFAAAGCQRVHLWPLGDERRQIERVAAAVAPQIESR